MIRFLGVFTLSVAVSFSLGCIKKKVAESVSSTQKKTKLGFVLATMNEERYLKD